LVSTENKKYKVTHYNDLCYNPANLKFGVICLNKYGDAIFSPIYVTFEVDEKVDVDFIGANVTRWDFINHALRFQQGTVYERMAVSPEDFLSIQCYLPSKNEQVHIASLMRVLDNRIEKQQSYVGALKKYKRGAVRRLLSAKSCPLKNASWTTAKMGELGYFIKGAPLSKADISEDGTPFILYGELYTTYNEVVTSVKRRTQAQIDETFLSRVGDVVIPTSGETPEEISTASCVMLPDVILAGDLNIFRGDKVDGRIMSYLLNHVVNAKIARIAQGKSVVHIQASELCKLTLTYPDKSTQNTIIGFLSSLDDRIMNEENALAFLSDLKEGLLQQLFI
jgi:type I restriction enzyme S subunit